MSANKLTGDGHLPSKKHNHAIYEAAAQSLRNNQHIKNMVFHDNDYFRIRMRQIQGTYKVQQEHWPAQGYGFRIRLIWDHDRLWGTFELGFFKGVFLVDPGPGQEHFEADDEYHYQHAADDEESRSATQDEDEDENEDEREVAASREYPLEWRGTSTQTPDTLFHSPLTVGKIRFGLNEIWGHFEMMPGIGLPDHRCEFHGKQPFGPALVSVSIQDVIDEWNDHGAFCDDEAPRTINPDSNQSTKDEDNSPSNTSQSIPEDQKDETIGSATTSQSRAEDQKDLFRSFTGIFDIASEAIEQEWPTQSHGLTIRFHIDERQKKTWGYFDLGIVNGYLILNITPDQLAYDTPMEFRWRARESETGSPSNGEGKVTIWEDRRVRGIFLGMIGDIDFQGKRKFMPSGISGYETDWYSRGWEDYARGGDSLFYR